MPTIGKTKTVRVIIGAFLLLLPLLAVTGWLGYEYIKNDDDSGGVTSTGIDETSAAEAIQQGAGEGAKLRVIELTDEDMVDLLNAAGEEEDEEEDHDEDGDFSEPPPGNYTYGDEGRQNRRLFSDCGEDGNPVECTSRYRTCSRNGWGGVVQLAIAKNDGTFGGCSGFLLAPDLVVTAGHCVRSVSEWKTSGAGVTALLGQTSANNPIEVRKSIHVQSYLNVDKREWDVAMIVLDTPFTKGCKYTVKRSQNRWAWMAGFPSTLPYGTLMQVQSEGMFSYRDSRRTADTKHAIAGGMSGGPAESWYRDGTTHTTGILVSYNDHSSCFTTITLLGRSDGVLTRLLDDVSNILPGLWEEEVYKNGEYLSVTSLRV